jgi:hypothetical protein
MWEDFKHKVVVAITKLEQHTLEYFDYKNNALAAIKQEEQQWVMAAHGRLVSIFPPSFVRE